MTSMPGWALQQAIYQALVADAALTNLLGGAAVYDDVPQRAAFPYVTIGEGVARDWGSATEDGQEHTLSIHVWSKGRGRREVHAIADAVRAVLHDAPLSLPGHALVSLRFELSDTRRVQGGKAYHAILRFRAVTEAIA